MKAVFGDRDVAMKNGVFIEGTRYEVRPAVLSCFVEH